MCSNQRIFKGMFHLMSLSVCVLVGNAEAERCFSTQNRIKTKNRTCLLPSTLDMLMRISMSNYSLDNFPINMAVEHFDKTPPQNLTLTFKS